MHLSTFFRINAKLFYIIKNMPPLECLVRMVFITILILQLLLQNIIFKGRHISETSYRS